jgi:hypothetical protein
MSSYGISQNSIHACQRQEKEGATLLRGSGFNHCKIMFSTSVAAKALQTFCVASYEKKLLTSDTWHAAHSSRSQFQQQPKHYNIEARRRPIVKDIQRCVSGETEMSCLKFFRRWVDPRWIMYNLV